MSSSASSTEAKQTVLETYNALAPWYLTWITSQSTHPKTDPRTTYTTLLLSSLPTTSPKAPQLPQILDLGSGPGIPTAAHLLRAGAHVLLNDLSPTQLALAASALPPHLLANTTFLPGDATALSFPASSLSGAVSFFALFHLPRVEQAAMLRKVHGWLRPGAVFVFNLGTVEGEEVWGEMMGRGMFWSGWGVKGNRGMVVGAGFEVVREEVVASEVDGGVEFWWCAARKAVGQGDGKREG